MARKKANTITVPPTRAELLAFAAKCTELAMALCAAIKESDAKARAEAETRARARRELAATKATVKRAHKVARGLPR